MCACVYSKHREMCFAYVNKSCQAPILSRAQLTCISIVEIQTSRMLRLITPLASGLRWAVNLMHSCNDFLQFISHHWGQIIILHPLWFPGLPPIATRLQDPSLHHHLLPRRALPAPLGLHTLRSTSRRAGWRGSGATGEGSGGDIRKCLASFLTSLFLLLLLLLVMLLLLLLPGPCALPAGGFQRRYDLIFY